MIVAVEAAKQRVAMEADTMSGLMFADNFVGICKVIGGDTECPLQVCQLSRSSESTCSHFIFLGRDVALFDSTRAPDSF